MKNVSQLAEELRVTPQTVRNEIHRQGFAKLLQKQNGQFCMTEEQEYQIKSAISNRQQNKTFAKPLQKQNGDLAFALHEIDEKNDQIRRLQESIEKLQDENQKLLRANENLTAAVQGLTDSLRGAQALHAGTLQERIGVKTETFTEAAETVTDQAGPAHNIEPVEADPEAAAEAPANDDKKRWWQFWK